MVADLWHVLWFLIQSAFAAVLAVVALVGLLPTKVGDKFLNHYLEQKLTALRHDYNRQIEELKAELAHLGDRGVRSNEREFNAVSAVWEHFVDAYVRHSGPRLRLLRTLTCRSWRRTT